MDFEKDIFSFLSTCDGVISSVFYELYMKIGALEEIDQIHAVTYVCENYDKIKCDYSNKITKKYYTDEQLDKISEKFIRSNLRGKIVKIAEDSSKAMKSKEDFYSDLWLSLTKEYKSKRERALILYEIVNSVYVPYRPVGVGISMSNDEYKKNLDSIGKECLDDTHYILALNYAQKTQMASLLAEKYNQLQTLEEQSVYLATIIRLVEQNIKSSINSLLD